MKYRTLAEILGSNALAQQVEYVLGSSVPREITFVRHPQHPTMLCVDYGWLIGALEDPALEAVVQTLFPIVRKVIAEHVERSDLFRQVRNKPIDQALFGLIEYHMHDHFSRLQANKGCNFQEHLMHALGMRRYPEIEVVRRDGSDGSLWLNGWQVGELRKTGNDYLLQLNGWYWRGGTPTRTGGSTGTRAGSVHEGIDLATETVNLPDDRTLAEALLA